MIGEGSEKDHDLSFHHLDTSACLSLDQMKHMLHYDTSRADLHASPAPRPDLASAHMPNNEF